MIEPLNFSFNSETAVNNAFQVDEQMDNVQQKALEEFNAFVQVLRNHHVEVTVVKDTPFPNTPDSIFLTTGYLFMVTLYVFTPCMPPTEDLNANRHC